MFPFSWFPVPVPRVFPSLFMLYGMVFEGIGEWETGEGIREYISYKVLTRDK
jgi:hypothetical protein